MGITAQFVAPEGIQAELSKLWESLETKNVTRASLFNLIFFTSKNHRTSYIQKIAQKVIEKFPSRIIFLMVDGESPDPFLTTKVSILTSSKGEFDVACDYIQVEVGGDACKRLPSLVLPHLLTDLPVYLVWAEDPTLANSLCYPLEQLANRLIFDSETTDHLPNFAKTLLTHYHHPKADIADLNWARLESWRDLFSIVFHSEERLSQIQQTRMIKIAYNAQETPFFCHTKIQSVYLQAWLSCQLGWTFTAVQQGPSTLEFSYTASDRLVQITLIPERHSQLPPGVILSVEISTQTQDLFLMKRDHSLLHQITLEHSNPHWCDLPCHYLFSKAESGHSLVKEICHRGTSEHYLKVLHRIAQMEGIQ